MVAEILEESKSSIILRGQLYEIKCTKLLLYNFYQKIRLSTEDVVKYMLREWCDDKMKRRTDDLELRYEGLKEMSAIVEKFMEDEVSHWEEKHVEVTSDTLKSYTDDELGLETKNEKVVEEAIEKEDSNENLEEGDENVI